MAKVYEDQDKFDEAARIYQYLLKREPNRQDLMEALSELEKKRFENNFERLFNLFSKWVDLLLKSDELQKLKKLRSHIKDKR